MTVELLRDSLHIILGDLAQTAHHVVHILNRQVVLRLIQSRHKCFQFTLDISDTFLVGSKGLIIALFDVISRLSNYFGYLFAIFINPFVALFVVVLLGLRHLVGKQ